MCCGGAAFECAALFQEDLPEGRERMRHQVGPVAFGREQNQVGEALDPYGSHFDEVGVAALKALLYELIDVTVQTVGHLVPFSGSGSDTAGARRPCSKASESCLTKTQCANGCDKKWAAPIDPERTCHDLSASPRLQRAGQLANDRVLDAEVIDLLVRLGLRRGHRSV
jgi:hypothetical protein